MDESCCICLENIYLEYKTQCGHIFCYTCLKTSYNVGNTRCPLCRQDIPKEFFENAKSCKQLDISDSRWFYSGRTGGYWAFNKENDEMIESIYKQDPEKIFDIRILGKEYVIDLKNMRQIAKETYKSRSIFRKKDVPIAVKGIAGLKNIN